MVSKKPIQAIVGHVGIEVSSLRASKKFYKTLLEGLGFKVIMDSEDAMGFSNQSFQVWVAESREPRLSVMRLLEKSSSWRIIWRFSFKTRELLMRLREK